MTVYWLQNYKSTHVLYTSWYWNLLKNCLDYLYFSKLLTWLTWWIYMKAHRTPSCTQVKYLHHIYQPRNTTELIYSLSYELPDEWTRGCVRKLSVSSFGRSHPAEPASWTVSAVWGTEYLLQLTTFLEYGRNWRESAYHPYFTDCTIEPCSVLVSQS